eukprot:9729626-Alexandrium_andersonii.AAC.1
MNAALLGAQAVLGHAAVALRAVVPSFSQLGVGAPLARARVSTPLPGRGASQGPQHPPVIDQRRFESSASHLRAALPLPCVAQGNKSTAGRRRRWEENKRLKRQRRSLEVPQENGPRPRDLWV